MLPLCHSGPAISTSNIYTKYLIFIMLSYMLGDISSPDSLLLQYGNENTSVRKSTSYKVKALCHLKVLPNVNETVDFSMGCYIPTNIQHCVMVTPSCHKLIHSSVGHKLG